MPVFMHCPKEDPEMSQTISRINLQELDKLLPRDPPLSSAYIQSIRNFRILLSLLHKRFDGTNHGHPAAYCVTYKNLFWMLPINPVLPDPGDEPDEILYTVE